MTNQRTYELPQSWCWKSLGDVATLINGRAYKKNELLDEGPTPVLRVGNFFSNRGWYYSDLKLPDDKYCISGDLLYAWSASFGPKIWEGGKAIYHYHIWKIITSAEIDKKFLYWLLEQDSEDIKSSGNGIAMMHATKGGMEKRQIPLPPLAEQKQIAEILDAADSLRQKDQQLIEHYTALSQSLFLDMFGDYFKRKECYQEIGEVTNFIDYRGKTPARIVSGIPLIGAKSVRPGYFDKSRLDFISEKTYQNVMTRGYPRIGDVLFTTEGATMGYTCRIPNGFDRFAVGQRLITLQSKHLYNNVALEFVINSREVQGEIFLQATGSAAKGIRSAKFAKILIPVPPLKIQDQFAEGIISIDLQKQQAQESLAKSEDLFNSLLQRAFKGELTGSKAA
ncbi:MAG: type I restriction enzyme S subunit [Arenicella sp.]